MQKKKQQKEIKIREVWMANFQYEDANKTSQRPVVVMDVVEGQPITLYVSLKVTSKPARNKFGSKNTVGPASEFEIPLLDWLDDGLWKPSIVRVQKQAKMIKEDFLYPLGVLTQNDWQNVNKAYKKLLMKEQRKERGGR